MINVTGFIELYRSILLSFSMIAALMIWQQKHVFLTSDCGQVLMFDWVVHFYIVLEISETCSRLTMYVGC